jgi:hypothetical protein
VNTGCPSCGWPVDYPTTPASTHRSATGEVRYQRCVCGGWLVLLDGTLLAGVGAARSTPVLRSPEGTSIVPKS